MNEELPVLFLEQYHDAWVMNSIEVELIEGMIE